MIQHDRSSFLGRVAQRLFRGTLHRAFERWNASTGEARESVRLHMLAQEMARKKYLQLVFAGLKEGVQDQKTAKQVVLFRTWKCWCDYLKYQRFMRKSALALLRRDAEGTQGMLQACFDAMRNHKEESRAVHHEEELRLERPRRQECQSQIERVEQESSQKGRATACLAVRKALSKGVHTYFAHWRKSAESYKEALHTRVRLRVLDLYHGKLRAALSTWKGAKGSGQVQQGKRRVQMLQEENEENHAQVMQMERHVEQAKQQVAVKSGRQLGRCLKSYFIRMHRVYFRRWKDSKQRRQAQVSGAETIKARLRKRMLRRAFDKYRSKVAEVKAEEYVGNRLDYFRRNHDFALKRRAYGALRLFVQEYTDAKKMLLRAYNSTCAGT